MVTQIERGSNHIGERGERRLGAGTQAMSGQAEDHRLREHTEVTIFPQTKTGGQSEKRHSGCIKEAEVTH